MKRGWQIASSKHRKILKLLREGVGIRRTASIVGVGVRTVQRRAEYLRQQSLGPGDIDFVPVAKRYCSRHGYVKFWPCVACAGESAKGVQATGKT